MCLCSEGRRICSRCPLSNGGKEVKYKVRKAVDRGWLITQLTNKNIQHSYLLLQQVSLVCRVILKYCSSPGMSVKARQLPDNNPDSSTPCTIHTIHRVLLYQCSAAYYCFQHKLATNLGCRASTNSLIAGALFK